MKRNCKGISMISLIVVIVSIIILSGIAITAGYRYVKESQEAEKSALTSLISEAAYRRQNEHNVDTSSYYAGSYLNEEDITSENFRGLPDNFETEKEKILTELNGLDPIWFVLDGESAKNLGINGIDDYDKYLVDNFNSIESSGSTNYYPVALVEYITGNTYLVEMRNTLSAGLNPSSHEHVWIVATCTEPMTCKICNETRGTALGHDIIEATCTQAEMCRRCGTIFAPALGHDFEGATYQYDAIKHWIECKNGCGTRKEVGNHSKNYIYSDDNYHIENCYICGWESTDTPHSIALENIDDTHHRRYCTLCDYDVTHTDGGWEGDNHYHWKICNTCGDPTEHKIFTEFHIDGNGDNICDVCGRLLDTMPPVAFDRGDIEVTLRTTHQIEVRAKTEDNSGGLGIASYSFSIDNGNTWTTVNVNSDSESATYKFTNLIQNQGYSVLVRATDKAGNYVDGTITSQTYQVPNQLVSYSTSTDDVTAGSVDVTLSLPTITSLPQAAINELKIVYKIDGESTEWIDYTTPISVTRDETTVILARIVDKKSPEPNSSSMTTTISIDNVDKTAPIVAIEATNPLTLNTSHTATIRITDAKAGIPSGERIYYAWTTSTTAPTSYTEYVTVPSNSNDVSLNVTTPADVIGKYYLWIKSGVEDAVGNATTTAVRSDTYFEIDDIAPKLNTRTMRNVSVDAIDELYVKTGKDITITIVSDKELSKGPLVTIGTKSARAISSDNIHWTATITADTTLTEGLLNSVEFGDYLSVAGKAGQSYTTTSDAKYVTYDKTLPKIVYINKGNVINVPDMNITFTGHHYKDYTPRNPQILLEPNTTYTLSFDYVVNSASYTVATGVGYGVRAYQKDIVTLRNYPNQTSGRQVVVFTTPDKFVEEYEPAYLRIRFVRMSSSGDANVDISNVTLQMGETDGQYIPYIDASGTSNTNANSVVNKVKVGDYIKYEPDRATYNPDPLKTGSTNTTAIGTDTTMIWRVWENDGTTVKIIPVNPVNTLYLGTQAPNDATGTPAQASGGGTGFGNAVKTVDDVCKILYSKSGYSTNVRSMTYEDIQSKLKTPFSPSGTNFAYYLSTDSTFSNGSSSKNGKSYTRTKCSTNNYKNGLTESRFYAWDEGTGIEYDYSKQLKYDSNGTPYMVPTEGHPVYITYTMTTGSIASSNWQDVTDSHVSTTKTYGDILGTANSWLASTCISSYAGDAYFSVRYVGSSGFPNYYALYTTFGRSYTVENGLRPIVTLNRSVLVSGGDGSTSTTPFTLTK